MVTIGVFDGVHRGHQHTIGRAVERARAVNQASVVLTFDPHPSEVVRPGTHPAMLTTQRYKAELLEALGVDVMCVLPFTLEFSRLGPDAFVHSVLVEALHASLVVVGENFRFGHKQAGDLALLQSLGARFGFAAEGAPVLAEHDTTLSSTYVRSCVAAGDVTEAAYVLGREHRVEGVVVRGDRRGREIGFPTANIEPTPHAAVPADGVYAGRLVRAGERLPAALSIGTNPTFAGRERRLEAFVLDVPEDEPLDLYGEHVGVDFTARLRDMERYDTVDELVKQIADDVERTRDIVR